MNEESNIEKTSFAGLGNTLEEAAKNEENAAKRSQSLLDILTPQRIIEDFKAKNDCTEEIVELIKTTPHSLIRKLKIVFLGIDNFEIQSLLELTQSKRRIYRYISTYLIFCKIKTMSTDFDKIEALYNSVFVVRFRDVDPSIRSMCVEFMTEWILESEALTRMEFLKYVGWALNDKSDIVRRKAIKSFTTLASKKSVRKSKRQNATRMKELADFFKKYKNRLLEISEFDSNLNLQKDGVKAVLSIFNKNDHIFTGEEILRVMSLENSVSAQKQEALNKICPEGIWDLEEMHRALRDGQAHIFRNMILNDELLGSFLTNLGEFAKNRSNCCETGFLCMLDILKEIQTSVNPKCYSTLFEIIKDNKENMKRMIEGMKNILSFKEFPSETFILIDIVKKSIYDSCLNNKDNAEMNEEENQDNCLNLEILHETEIKNVNSNCDAKNVEMEILEAFVIFLKKIEDDFSIQVKGIVNELKTEILYIVIKYFDVSECVSSNSEPVLKCYAALWKIMKEDFDWIRNIDFQYEYSNHQIPHYLELLDFLHFFHSKSVSTSSDPADPFSASKVVFDKLYSFVYNNCYFNDESSCLRLYNLVNSGIFLHLSYILFFYCTDEQLRYFIENAKVIKHITVGYFESLLKLETNQHNPALDPKRLSLLAKPLCFRLTKCKNEDNSYLFNFMKQLAKKKDILDSILIHFVPFLSVNECIFMESIVEKSKFKTACLRRCKAIKPIKAEENVTFI